MINLFQSRRSKVGLVLSCLPATTTFELKELLTKDMMIELYKAVNKYISEIIQDDPATCNLEIDPFVAQVRKTQMFSYYKDVLCRE